jgi:hypothetical protein
MKRSIKPLLLPLLAGALLAGCKATSADPTPTPAPVSETKRITDGLTGKTWKAQKVQEGIQTVFLAGQPSNLVPGYQNYQLAFTGSKAKLTEYTLEAFEGDWAVAETGGRTYLTLRNLAPAPTNTGGTLEFEVSGFSETGLTLTATKANLKTGNSLNTYALMPK